MIVTVDTAKLATPELLARYTDRRNWPYFKGMRFALELLGIDPPGALKRKPTVGCHRSANPSRMTLWRDKQKAKLAIEAAALQGMKP